MRRKWFSKLAKVAVFSFTVNAGLCGHLTAQELELQADLPSAFSPTERRSGTESLSPAESLSPDEELAAPISATEPWFLSFAKFKIPFNIEAHTADLKQVQLWVSIDQGDTWQMHGSARPDAKHFDFRAAAEGLYLFSVQTVDATGIVVPSNGPPLKVFVDTTKPDTAIRADINSTGELVVDVRVFDENLDLTTAVLKMRTDRDSEWKSLDLPEMVRVDDIYEGQLTTRIGLCREVAVVFAISDKANNTGEASYKLDMPRTAQGDSEMTLASNRQGGLSPSKASVQSDTAPAKKTTPPTIPGAIAWKPSQGVPETAEVHSGSSKAAIVDLPGPGRLASAGHGELSLDGAGNSLELEPAGAEELPLPHPVATTVPTPDEALVEKREEVVTDLSSFGQAFHCKSRAFSLDYSVDALGGSSLADVELWGTEDGGRTWQQWGSDPDRQSPFDVQVGNDGMFGFRMVIVGANGLVSNRPKDGDSADVWINVDTSVPSAKITRAVYGEGPEDGMLVIDYKCQDGHLVDRPIALSFSETIDGPWNTIATGLKNTGIYLWKANPNLPEHIYIRIEAVDKAGNIGAHRLDLPIDTKGLAPRGRIQGFRPILDPSE